ncbi:alpha/beta hydrolase [Lactococcus termiticola]|uniref:Alpha/beta hydrolase n=1 Tax=Lactococcus termiticola TaxID=2169526 RepID=A0A2R5HJS9_9LACT|nr:alpha/beta hydrolase [Lactococcus termiticola]
MNFIMKNKKKHFLRWIIGIFVALVIIDVGVTLYFYKVACIRNDSPVTQVATVSKNYHLVQDFDKLSVKTETIKNGGLKLDAWYVPATVATNKTVIVVHGFRQDKSAMRQYGELFHQLGYNVLMPDNRAAGDSQGKFISYGYKDKTDVIAWAKMLTQQNSQVHITLFGLSMGAATVMMASDQPDLPSSVKNIIEDCGYSSVWSEITYQGWSGYHVPAFPIVYSVSAENAIRQGWFFQQASSTSALAKDKLPILLIHGGTDTYVPTKMVYENYKAVKKGTPKELLIVKGAAHARSFETDPTLYRSTVSKFMMKYNPVK